VSDNNSFDDSTASKIVVKFLNHDDTRRVENQPGVAGEMLPGVDKIGAGYDPFGVLPQLNLEF
jgi:hypothetical protein